jgi:hypothetical protein
LKFLYFPISVFLWPTYISFQQLVFQFRKIWINNEVIDFRYRISPTILVRYRNAQQKSISLITDVGLSAHLWTALRGMVSNLFSTCFVRKETEQTDICQIPKYYEYCWGRRSLSLYGRFLSPPNKVTKSENIPKPNINSLQGDWSAPLHQIWTKNQKQISTALISDGFDVEARGKVRVRRNGLYVADSPFRYT